MNKIIEIIDDTMKMTADDGIRRYSYLRVAAFVWFWLVLVPIVWACCYYNRPIDGEIAIITGILFLGVVGGKVVGTAAQYVDKVAGK